MLDKKRDLLPHITDCIDALMKLSSDAAKLEIHDNDQASRRLKQGLKDFEVLKYKPLKDKVLSIRQEINSKNQKKQKSHESEQQQQSESVKGDQRSEQQQALGTE